MNLKKIMKPQRSPIWEDMKPAALRKLALAVTLVFAVFGPIQVLMLPVLPDGVWYRLIATTLTSGGFAGCIILFGRRLLYLLLTIAVFVAIILSIPVVDRMLLGERGKPSTTAEDGTTILSKEEMEEQGHWRLLIGMAGIAMIVSGYAVFIFVITKEVQRRARLESEMSIAQSIQSSLLPAAPLALPWCEIAGVCIPAAEIGGDYFDVIKISESEAVIVVGDVAGHGLGAGILAAMTKSALYSHLQQSVSPRHILAQLNQTLSRLTNKSSFVTFACALLDNRSRLAKLATAGHPPLLHFQAASQKITAWRTPSLGLGLHKEATFEEIEIPFAAGDLLLAYTDGVTEASNRAAEQFDEERLCGVIMAQMHASASQVSAAVIQAVQNFSAAESLPDDATVVCMRVI
jgi:hypothetical protein